METTQIFVSIGVLSFLLGLYRITNGRMARLEKDKVSRENCHVAMNGLREMRKNDRTHIDERFDSLERFIDKLWNGKK